MATLPKSTTDAMIVALSELIAEWDLSHAHEDHRTGYTPDTGGIILARQALELAGASRSLPVAGEAHVMRDGAGWIDANGYEHAS